LTRAAAVIPARFQSTRFPGKPLALILGKPMLRWVYEAVRQAGTVERVLIATDDSRIGDAAAGFGADVVMTSPDHSCGTDRVAEVAECLPHSIILNVQGDEPLVTSGEIDRLVEVLQDPCIPMASLMMKVHDVGLICDPHLVKVVVDGDGYALYFSRSPLPYLSDDFFYLHSGIYGFQRDFLLQFSRLPDSRLERIEKLEQLRVLENGRRIKMIETAHPALRVDTPQDIIRVEEFLKQSAR
jgi:3-deoxy-manno-octulosonate cytidylyltransferase (CMP-KDO synthetase)